MDALTISDLRAELVAQCEQSGGLRAWARRKGVPHSLVSATLSGAREPGETIANALGMVRQVTFRRVREVVR